jgi:hypothetical protein
MPVDSPILVAYRSLYRLFIICIQRRQVVSCASCATEISRLTGVDWESCYAIALAMRETIFTEITACCKINTMSDAKIAKLAWNQADFKQSKFELREMAEILTSALNNATSKGHGSTQRRDGHCASQAHRNPIVHNAM